MKRIIFVGYLVVIILISMCACDDTKNLERRQNRYYPYRVITESGEELSIGLVTQTESNDPIVTVVLIKNGKEYYYDLRK